MINLFQSSLPSARRISGGKYQKVLHFDGKEEIEEYIRAKNIPAAYLDAGFYMTNFQYFFPPFALPDGTVVFSTPMKEDTVVPLIDIPSDFGKIAFAMIKGGLAQFKGKHVLASSGYISMKDVVATFAKGKPISFSLLE